MAVLCVRRGAFHVTVGKWKTSNIFQTVKIYAQRKKLKILLFLHLSRIVIAKTLLNIETKKKALKNTVKLARVSASNRFK